MTTGVPIVVDMHMAHLLRRATPAEMAGAAGRAPGGPDPSAGDITPGLRNYIRQSTTPDVRRVGTAAYIQITGAIMDDAGWLYEWGPCLTHRSVADEVLRQAADPTVATIVLELNCNGWGAPGCSTTLDALRQAKKAKRLVALVNASAFSGGAWIAAEAEETAIVPEGRMGHIGTILHTITDEEFVKKMGLKPEVIASHPDKACGYPGVPWSDEFRATQQAIVDEHSESFFADVAAGRGMTVQAVKDLHAHMFAAKESVRRGLADVVETVASHEARYSGLAPRAGSPAARPPAAPAAPTTDPELAPSPQGDGEDEPQDAAPPQGDPMDLSKLSLDDLRKGAPGLVKQMEDEAAARSAQDIAAAIAAQNSTPATFDQLKQVYGDDAAGVVRSLEAKHTLPQAREAHAKGLRDQLQAANTRLADLEKKAKPASGVAPVEEAGAPSLAGNPGEHEFIRQVNARVNADKCTLAQAMVAVAGENPALHADYCRSTPHKARPTSPAVRRG